MSINGNHAFSAWWEVCRLLLEESCVRVHMDGYVWVCMRVVLILSSLILGMDVGGFLYEWCMCKSNASAWVCMYM